MLLLSRLNVAIFICFVGFVSGQPILPPDEVESLRVVANVMGKSDWNFSVDPCSGLSGWVTQNPVKGFENALTCDCTFENNTVCHVVSILSSSRIFTAFSRPQSQRTFTAFSSSPHLHRAIHSLLAASPSDLLRATVVRRPPPAILCVENNWEKKHVDILLYGICSRLYHLTLPTRSKRLSTLMSHIRTRTLKI